MKGLIALLRAIGLVLFLLIGAPLLLAATIAVLAAGDFLGWLRRRPPLPEDQRPSDRSVSVVIPTWNGRPHLERNLASVVTALADNADNEIIVVDNASTDGTAEFLRRSFPSVRVLELATNEGFGGGSNAGFRAARHDIVVLLNNDMRVEPDFLAPLVEGFSDPRVFAVSSQIFFSDPSKRREETGLTQGAWNYGRLQVRHVIDDQVQDLFPTFYAGGGSTAYDRRKFLELGGFEPLLEPFYLEDTDISYIAWKRGWFLLYQPRSIVYHEHRGTIGKHFNEAYILAVLEKNNLLFTWKNIHEWKRLLPHFFWLYAGLWVRLLAGPSPTRPSARGLIRACSKPPRLLGARRRARALSVVGDTEAFRRPLGGYFRDRFGAIAPDPERLAVLFVSPYPIEPPLHGGAVFMNQTVRHLARLCDLHLLCLLDEPGDLETNQQLAPVCAGTEFVVRWQDPWRGFGGLLPHAAETFHSQDLLWRIHRTIWQRQIDVVQLEYTQLATYAAEFQRIGTFLFEHDIYFQSVLRSMKGITNPRTKLEHVFEYLRALRFERRAVTRFDAVQVCTAANRRYLESFAWKAAPILEGLRAGIDVDRYEYTDDGREPDTLLFVGNFRHPPNQQALEFFLEESFPSIRERRPQARLVVIGAHAQPGFEQRLRQADVAYLGRVDDIRQALAKYAVFVSPILSGSGVRVKLLEAFAAGIPAVSTTLGAEGLLDGGRDFVEIADSGDTIAHRVVALLEDPRQAREMARRARHEVERNWNMRLITGKLEQHYRQVLREKQARHLDHDQPAVRLPDRAALPAERVPRATTAS